MNRIRWKEIGSGHQRRHPTRRVGQRHSGGFRSLPSTREAPGWLGGLGGVAGGGVEVVECCLGFAGDGEQRSGVGSEDSEP